MAVNTIQNNIEYEKKSEPVFIKKDRLTYIDIAKGIGISMIVWGHAHCTGGVYFISYAVPLFFLISGFLYNEKLSFKEFTKRKIVSLYLPFLLCNLLWPTFILCCKAHAGYPITSNLNYIFLIILTLKKDGFLFGATWFLGSLLFASISYKIIDLSLNRLKYKNYLILSFYVLLAVVACQFTPFLDMETRRTLIVPIFFAIGAFIKTNIGYIRKINNKSTMIAACVIFILFEAYLTKTGMVGYLYKTNTLYHLITFVINALLSSYIIIYLSKIASLNINNKVSKAFSYLGQNSLYILLWHFVFFELLTALFLKVNNIPLSLIDRFPHAIKTDGIWWLVYFLIGIFGPIGLMKIYNVCKKSFFKVFTPIKAKANQQKA